MGDRVVMDAMLLVEHVVLDMVIGWWTRILGCVAVVVCNFGLLGFKNPAIYRATARLLAISFTALLHAKRALF